MNPQRSRLARAAAGGAIFAGFVLVLVLLFGSSSGRTYHLLFENGGQLVGGNQVLIAGQPIGKVTDVSLTDNAQAEVTISVDEPLHQGTTAIIRATSLSGIANRYVSITQGPNNAPVLADGATLTGERTTSPVDLDQLFNTFTPRTRQALQRVIQGSAAIYSGRGPQANRTYKYLAPGLTQTRRLLDELTRDQASFTNFLVSSSRVVTAVAARRADLSSLVGNANTSLGAIARENTSLDRSLVALPPTLRQANTTFVNLRAALDDLDPLVNDAKPATKDLTPFLRELRPVAEHAVPVVHHLGQAIGRKGKANDLTDALRDLPQVRANASAAVPRVITALDAAQPDVEFARPYTPDLLGWITKFGESTAYYDGNGHYARVMPIADAFKFSPTGPLAGDLLPISALNQFDFYTSTPGAQAIYTRCPGGATQAIAGSNPFTDNGNLLAPPPAGGKCDPGDVPPGP